MLVTVATPTYNRAHLLARLYESLCLQSCRDFEWLVVDDGSSDDTENLVRQFIEQGKLSIRYFKKPNGGKHTAVNLAAREARGELFFIADSDDWLPSDSIEQVVLAYKGVKDSPEFGGVCGLDAFPDGKIVGSGLGKEIIDASYLEIREHYGVSGDMKEVYLTDVMREFPFPEIPGERFCSEALVWNRIAAKYKLRYFNKPIYIAEYQGDGITSGITRARMSSPVASMLTYSEWIGYGIPWKKKLRYAANYWRFAFCTKERNVKIAPWARLLAPIGLILHLKDKRNFKE